MMVKLLLSNHKKFKWQSNNEKNIRGMYFLGNEYFEDEAMLVPEMGKNENEFKNFISKINGNYSIIIESKKELYFAVDRISSLPLFYCISKNCIYISDSILMLRSELSIEELSNDNVKEFLATGYVTGERTLFDNIFMLQAGQYAVVEKDNANILIHDYFLHNHSEKSSESIQDLVSRLDQVVLNIFKRAIKSFNNRTVVLFLSGGYDSRLIAVNLKRLNYTNVICVSFGDENIKDVKCAKEIAKSLGYPLLRIKTNKRWFKIFKRTEIFNEAIEKNSYGYAINYPQGLYIYEMIKNGKIPEDSIVITGNSGDVVEGNDVCMSFKEGEDYDEKQVLEAILKQHYLLQGEKYQKQKIFESFIKTVIGSKKKYNYIEAQNTFEFFNWRARQAKYVVNDVVNFNDILGLDWRLPLWDNEFVDFWLSIPLNLRYKRKLYYLYVKEEKLPTANNINLNQKMFAKLKRNTPIIIDKARYIVRLMHFFNSKNVDPLGMFGLVSFFEFKKIMNYTKGYYTQWRTIYVLYVFRKEYKKYLNKENELLEYINIL